MKKIFPTLIFIVFFGIAFTFQFCGEIDKKNDFIELPEASIEIIDTLTIDHQGLLKIIEFDIDKKQYIAIDQISEEGLILIINEDGGIVEKFENATAGENKFKGVLKGIKSENQTKNYWVLTDFGLYKYNIEWKLLEFYQNPNSKPKLYNPQYNILEFNEDGKPVFFGYLNASNTGRRVNEIEFFREVENFTLITPHLNKFETIIKFEENSKYIKDKLIYPAYTPFFAQDSKHNIIYLGYPHETNLFKYIWQNQKMEFVGIIPLNLDYFNINFENYSKFEAPDIYNTGLDSRIEKVLSIGDVIVITYVKSFDRKAFENSGFGIDGGAEYYDFLEENYRQCIHILNKETKFSKDIVLPEYLSGPFVAFSETEFLMGIPRFRFESEVETFFKIKLKI